jgi:hypothetical protein
MDGTHESPGDKVLSENTSFQESRQRLSLWRMKADGIIFWSWLVSERQKVLKSNTSSIDV